MATMQPEQALFLRDWMLGALKREHSITRGVIDAVPHDKGDYRPDAIVKPAVDLARHIVGAEHRFMDSFVNAAFHFSNTGRPAELRTPSDLARLYGDTFQGEAAH